MLRSIIVAALAALVVNAVVARDAMGVCQQRLGFDACWHTLNR